MNRFIGKEGLAEYLDVSKETVSSWVWQRKIPYFKVGRLVKFDLKEIEIWVNEKKMDTIE